VRRAGSVLILVLVTLAVLSLLAITVAYRRTSDEAADVASFSHDSAKRLADSGLQLAMALAMDDQANRLGAAGGFYVSISDAHGYADENSCRDRRLGDDSGTFSLVRSPNDNDPAGELRYGYSDEASRLNVNTATRAQWRQLLAVFNVENVEARLDALEQYRAAKLDPPGTGATATTNPAAAAAFLNGVGVPSGQSATAGGKTGTAGATGGTGAAATAGASTADTTKGNNTESAAVPFRNKSGYLESVDELLRVTMPDGSPAFPRSLLFGPDRNRNGTVEPGENGAGVVAGNAGPVGGLYGYLTAWSVDYPVAYPDGRKLVNINQDINAVPAAGSPGSAGAAAGAATGAAQQTGLQKLQQELTDAGVDPQIIQAIVAFRRGSIFYSVGDLSRLPGVSPQALSDALNKVATVEYTVGAININTAPEPVLRALLARIPRLQDDSAGIADLASKLIAARPSGAAAGDIAWPLQVMSAEDYRVMVRFATVRSFQFRADCVGYTDDARGFARIEAVFDTALSKPRVLYYRDVSALGRPYRMQKAE
jgi:type II secretory pathway component PulK